MILFFDTETTGFAHKSKPIDHPDQPHVIQLAAILCEPEGRVVSGINMLIDLGVDKGVRIPSGAQAVHGIDEERLWRFGGFPYSALNAFEHMYARADLMVGHNINYDIEMMEIALSRTVVSKSDDPLTARTKLELPSFCTMKASTDICQLPSPRGGYKWPKLGEVYQHFFGEPLEGAHDAMVDLMACKRVYFHLKGLSAPAAKGGEW